MAAVAVIDYGMGNIHSIIKALRLYCDDVVFTDDIDVLRTASALVLPGDGAFAAAMGNLQERGLVPVLKEHVAAARPLLGVCIGFQVLFEDSDEAPRGSAPGTLVPGLGLLQGKIRRFSFEDPDLRIPHMGWNPLLQAVHPIDHFDGEHMYFIHSYRPVDVPEENVAAWCEYGGVRFAAAVVQGNLLAVQFHPEKSDRAGLQLLKEWSEHLVD